MIRLNKKIKYSFNFILGASLSLISFNTYKKHFSEYEIDLNKIKVEKSEKDKIIKNLQLQEEENYDPFELIKIFNKDEYFIEKLNVILYNPPLTNKLYPKSNLYGHELIRYFDK
jgi:hypothetical protein